LAGSVDGLMIVDSLGGSDLARRFTQTDGWTRFRLYRVAPQSGTMNVGFRLSGLGEAWIDDVTVKSIQPQHAPAVTRLPQAALPPR
jgi:hypothetical protein